ncbi:MAG: SGNH/GDSL hydrolase family protein [Verrucomicrobiales bacterium]|nr:SGNH/GDSL hydrolase family protein [Verrucomicrobiales bacterium]
MLRSVLLSLGALLLAVAPAIARPLPLSGPLELQDGDTVVLLGDAFFEREGTYGFIESWLTTRFPDRQIRFRNLAWSGDSPRGEARAYFGPPDEGLQRLQGHLDLVKPTVIFVCYGSAVLAEGKQGLEPSLASYARLLDLLHKTGAGIVLVSPPPAEEKGAAAPILKRRNTAAQEYAQAIQQLAVARKLRFADLFAGLSTPVAQGNGTLTVNGIHFTEAAYRRLAPAIGRALLQTPGEASPTPVFPDNPRLLAAIREKNQLFFYRWRPQNETYLFGFRKHEQGNNGVEIPHFDPLVAEKEQQIASLRVQPVP